MKNFPAAFAAQKNLKADVAPVWILKLRAGGVDYYISDNTFTVTPWGITTKPWAKGWGDLSEGISGLVDEFRISDFSVTCLAEPGASPNIVDLALSYNLEKDPCYLYLWFYGCADPPQEFFRGYLRDYPISEGDTICTLQLQDETLKWERSYVGNLITAAEYPDADPDDIGKLIPNIYGTVSKIQALAVDAGVQTSLTANLSAIATTFVLSGLAGLEIGAVVQIDEEQIRIDGTNGDTVTACTRGFNGTIASSHQRGAVVWEQQAVFIYLVADHPVDQIPRVYGKVGQTLLDVTPVCTVYTGKAGNENPDFPGKACVTFPDMITISQAANLTLTDGISVQSTLAINDALGISDGISLTDTISLADTIAVADTIEVNDGIGVADTIAVNDGVNINDGGHNHTTGSSSSSTTQGPQEATPRSGSLFVNASAVTQMYDIAGISFPAVSNITASTLNITVSASGANNRNGTYMWDVVVYGNGVYVGYQATSAASSLALSIPITNTAAMQCHGVMVRCSNDKFSGMTVSATIHSASRSITYTQGGVGTTTNTAYVTKSGTVSRSGGVTKSGNAAKSGTVTKSGTITKSGSVAKSGTVAKTGSVTQTGVVTKSGTVTLSGNSVANTMIAEAVYVDVVRNVTTPGAVIQDILSTWCGVTSFQQVGAFPASYQFNGAITEYRLAREVIHDLAWQCRSWFRHSLGSARLIVRSLTPTSVKALPWCRVEGGKKVHSRTRTEYGEIINVINLLYGRDWTRDKGDTAYTAVSSGSDAASIADFGVQERPELFKFDFVTSKEMADDLRAFYLAFYAVRHWAHTWETYYYDSELEFADAVTLGFAKDVLVQIQQAGLQPGSNTIQIKAIQ